MKTEYTKGEWEVKTAIGNPISIETIDSIITTFSWQDDYEAYSSDMNEIRANAKLIAAAPDMFEKLTKLLSWYKVATSELEGGPARNYDLVEEVEKVLQKATK